ncbi:hypothetical protein Tco_0449720 [Tanacetum coccineum]
MHTGINISRRLKYASRWTLVYTRRKSHKVKTDDPNITMEEYIRLEEEKAHRCGKVYNWETTTYGKIWYDKDVHDLRYVETEFPAIVFNDMLTFEVVLLCEPTDFEKEFPAIAYNDALTSDLLPKPTVNPQHIEEFDETSLFECDVIMEYLVKISKKARILELKRRNIKKLILTSYTPYSSRKIRHICAYTSQETTKIQSPIRYIQENSIRRIQYKVIKIFWKISNVVPTPRNPRYTVSILPDTA